MPVRTCKSIGARGAETALVTFAVALAGAPGLAPAQVQSNSESVVVTGRRAEAPDASEMAPSQAPLNARSAQSIVNDNFIRNYTPPLADYTQALAMTPGVFSYMPNGIGLGDAKIRLRGLSDDFFVISFDGIPFNDTNGVSHHSATFFPSPFLGGAVVDRSPGSAATVGQATFGGAIDLRSRALGAERRTSASLSLGSWNTRMLSVEHETGPFGAEQGSNLLINAHALKSDGYQTYNDQMRRGISLKYEQALSSATVLTVFASAINLKSHSPSTAGTLRSNYDNGDYRSLLTADPARGDYYGYNFADMDSSFAYAGIVSRLGGGWVIEDKLYRYAFSNQRNYNNGNNLTATSGFDRLNGFTTWGNLLRATQDSPLGTLRVGLWLDDADSNRYQIPSDPRTRVDVAAPTFSESYRSVTAQPYAEFEFKVGDKLQITPGIKYASYRQDFVQLQDNGGAVGPLGGVFNAATNTITGGAPSVTHGITYTDWLPSLDLRYRLRPDWTVYAQHAWGDEIPSTSVFDVKNAQVSPVPKATRAKTSQIGTVLHAGRFNFAADLYHTRLDGAYTALPPDANGNIGYVLSGTQVNKGIEGEMNVALGSGLTFYVNGTFGSLKYDTGQWVAGAPRDTESAAISWQRAGWAASLSANRVGKMFNDGKGGVREAFAIEPVVLTHLFINYTARGLLGFDRQTKFQLSVNNLLNRHDIVGVVTPAAGSSSAKQAAGDLLTVVAGRSVGATVTVEF